ncbi:hypothetical protein [Kitasatospora sp. NPDC059327]|uniref:hypothetical protein n=1 Tax=Kitasatospora sp. NPDC059327 TaxID=3346803 RepID=UPI0036BAB7F1
MKLSALGYWSSPEVPNLPDPTRLVDADLDESERTFVSDYLARGQVARQFMGVSRCRLCGNANGSMEMTDGTFIWPEGLGHYVLQHSVRLPRDFIGHIFARLEELDEASVDHSWWMARAFDV